MMNPNRKLKAIACNSFLGLALGLLTGPDAGAQTVWSKLTEQPFAAPGSSVDYRPDQPLYQLAAGYGKAIFAADKAGLHRSADGELSWSLADATGFAMSNALAADASGLVLFNKRISRDGGLTWKDLPESIGILPTAFAIRNGMVFTGGYYNHVNGSLDTAKTFKRMRTGPDVAWPTALEITEKSCIYLGLYSGGTFLSEDQGKTWSNHKGIVRSETEYGLIPAGAERMTSLRVAAGGDLIAGYFGMNGAPGTPGLFRISPDLKTSAAAEGGFPKIGVTALVRGPSGVLFAGTWGMGVYRSADAGKTWAALNPGLEGRHILALEINSGATLFAVTREGAFSMAKAEGAPAALWRNNLTNGKASRRAAVLEQLLDPARSRMRLDGRHLVTRRLP